MQIIFSSITKKILEVECEEVYFFTNKGKVGILNNHIKEEFIISSGMLRIKTKNEEYKFDLISGLASTENNTIKISAILKE